ncbi:MAG TPA: HAMP domain-containing sensor histidine kinase, partial [Methylomirabilota bacterium]|nr:HAMP domain-containing sensor histidine kinase [Methylomirabilota bacterium]
ITIMEYFDEIYRSNERLLALVRNLLSVSRIDQGKVKDAPQVVNVVELIKSITTDMSIIAAKNAIALHLDTKQTDIPSLVIDPLRFQEVIENLLSNAIKYNVANGKIDVIIDKNNDVLLLSVKDTGIGIATKDKQELFTKFFRAENAIKKNTEGSGLGLYVVKSYVESWGGKINVTSEEGKGATFTIEIPFTNEKKGGGMHENNSYY